MVVLAQNAPTWIYQIRTSSPHVRRHLDAKWRPLISLICTRNQFGSKIELQEELLTRLRSRYTGDYGVSLELPACLRRILLVKL